jgi:hypothetical protein
MKKAQFTSPIILILLIAAYFMIAGQISSVQSSLLNSRASLIKITNDIKGIEELDLEWQASLSSQALMLFSIINSSGTINESLESLNAIIYDYDNITLINYTKNYVYNGFGKTISGTILIPYPYFQFVRIENQLRECSKSEALEACIAHINNGNLHAELNDNIIYLSNDGYILTKELYPYMISFE